MTNLSSLQPLPVSPKLRSPNTWTTSDSSSEARTWLIIFPVTKVLLLLLLILSLLKTLHDVGIFLYESFNGTPHDLKEESFQLFVKLISIYERFTILKFFPALIILVYLLSLLTLLSPFILIYAVDYEKFKLLAYFIVLKCFVVCFFLLFIIFSKQFSFSFSFLLDFLELAFLSLFTMLVNTRSKMEGSTCDNSIDI